MTARSTRAILVFWAPLAATWLMMSMEAPYVAAIIAHLPGATYNLAAYGVAFALAWLAESPIMMLMTAANRLVHGRESFLAMRRFMYALNAGVTALMVLAITPPVFRFMAHTVMHLQDDIAHLAHVAMVVLIPWPASIGYRRFYQGVLVRHRLTRRVAYGTVVRLSAMTLTAAGLALFTALDGATIGAGALVTGVMVEAAAARWMARHIVDALRKEPPPVDDTPLTQRWIAAFYFPLALTSMIAMITGPLLTLFMGRGRAPIESLAVLPVVQSLLFIFRGGGVAYQEVGVALSGKQHEHEPDVAHVAKLLCAWVTFAFAVIVFTPLGPLWFHTVSGLPPQLASFALPSARILLLLPALEYWLSFQRSRFIVNGETRVITIATVIEVAGIAAILLLCVGPLAMIGVIAGVTAQLGGRVAANIYLALRMRAPATARFS
ncbi:MAG TPA: hypothetical protein VE967_00765 [Gemmatimonadaceae bacterium]|nr:hypothetical protein [Gemmatimonadaceae bacterium]